MSKTTNKFSTEVRARAERMVLDHEGNTPLAGQRRYRILPGLAVRRIRCWTRLDLSRFCTAPLITYRAAKERHKTMAGPAWSVRPAGPFLQQYSADGDGCRR